jgi:hypothetical protein
MTEIRDEIAQLRKSRKPLHCKPVPKYFRIPPIQCPNTSGNPLYSAQILQETSYTVPKYFRKPHIVPKYFRKPPIQCPNTSGNHISPNTSGNLLYSAQILPFSSCLD